MTPHSGTKLGKMMTTPKEDKMKTYHRKWYIKNRAKRLAHILQYQSTPRVKKMRYLQEKKRGQFWKNKYNELLVRIETLERKIQ